MNRLSTLQSTREQACHALLLLGAPAPARLVAEVHAALFDGDLSVPALAALVRSEERTWTPGTPWVVAPALTLDLTAAPGMLTLSTWSIENRIAGPADAYAQGVRIAEFIAARPGATASAARLLRRMAELEPVADGTGPARLAAAARAEQLDLRERVFGRSAVPHQRGGR